MSAKPVPPFEILRVRDTRDREEQGDRWVPIPGSGDARECDRCGRTHEIHAEVRDAAGAYWAVGVGCMDATTSEARSLSGRAVREANAAAKRAHLERLASEYASAVSEVAGWTFPVNSLVEGPGFGDGVSWSVDGVKVQVAPWADHEERLACLEEFWRQARVAELLGVTSIYRHRSAQQQLAS